MNRAIKFRAWDKVKRKMWEPHYLSMYGEALVSNPISGLPIVTDDPVMQFTGLHDKNGKEIYEGDVLASDYFKICSVVYRDAAFSLSTDLTGPDENPFLLGGCIDEGGSFEVIGNIYENLEFLNEVNHD